MESTTDLKKSFLNGLCLRCVFPFLKSQINTPHFLKFKIMNQRNIFKCPACNEWLKLEGFKLGTNGLCFSCRERVIPHGEKKIFIMIGLILAIKFKSLIGDAYLFGETINKYGMTNLRVELKFIRYDSKVVVDLNSEEVRMFEDDKKEISEEAINRFVLNYMGKIQYKYLSNKKVIKI